jgi:hypothetical protein
MGNANTADEEGSGASLGITSKFRKSGSNKLELSPYDSVLCKIREHEQYAELHKNEEYMARFAQCLSDAHIMRQTYLSLDWAISKEWVRVL